MRFFDDMRMRTMRTSPTAPVESTPPHDMALRTKLIRKSNRRGGLVLVFSTKPETVYFHLSAACLKKKGLKLFQDNIRVDDETLQNINEKHQEHMMKEFSVFV